MLRWLESIFVGFEEIHKIFEKNSLCVFFLLYAMNYRVLRIKQILGKESIDSSYYNILNGLLYESIPDVGFDKERYLKLFEQSDLNNLKEMCDEVLGTIQNKKSKFYLSFSMIGIFITDIYLMLRYYAGSFYNKYIKYKVNIKLDENEFHQNVPVQKIMIHSDADRRSAFIDLRCNSATAHKLAVLFVKEFELIISKYEDYFKIVGLKLYYLTPKIEKNDIKNTIDNYNFEAYIPTLIPLLTGDNIYARKEVFARELIQNSIDAISVRGSVESNFDKTIYITLGQIQDRRFFRIKDFGTGMDRFKIERYFTSIGRSFYSGDEYRDLELDYKPISNFGIGFLSAFMICREIDVKTRYYLDDKEGLKLHIPNYDGCFFIEKDDTLDIGTEITLYIDPIISHDIKMDKIIEYICNTMQDISCNIVIRNEINETEIMLEAKNIRKQISSKELLFVPFLESGNIIENTNVEKTIWSNDFLHKYPYGLLINVAGYSNNMGAVLNSGIKLYDTDVNDIWRMLFRSDIRMNRLVQNLFLFNFPSNYLNIDVSREKITDFVDDIIKSEFKETLLCEIYNQILKYIELCKVNEIKNKAINLYSLMMTLVYLCKQESSLSHLSSNIMSMRYVLYIRFNPKTIELLVSRSGSKPHNAIAYVKNNYTKCREAFLKFVSVNSVENDLESLHFNIEHLHRLMPNVQELIHRRNILLDNSYNDYYYNYRIPINDSFSSDVKEHLQKLYKSKDDNIVYEFLIISAFMLNKLGQKDHIDIMENILTILLEDFTISEVEGGKCRVSIEYEDIKKMIKRLK